LVPPTGMVVEKIKKQYHVSRAVKGGGKRRHPKKLESRQKDVQKTEEGTLQKRKGKTNKEEKERERGSSYTVYLKAKGAPDKGGRLTRKERAARRD